LIHLPRAGTLFPYTTLFRSREVHDTLAQRLTALSLQTGQMQKSLDTSDETELANALAETKQYSDQALRDLRSLVTSLRDQGELRSEEHTSELQSRFDLVCRL